MIETALRRKRDELARGWEEREAKLKALRAKERAMEERGRAGKRQRVGGDDDGGGASGKKEVDEEKEFLIGEWRDDDEGRRGDDPLGMFGRETRELLEKVGLAGRKGGEEEEDGGVEEEVKVCFEFNGDG
jgi:chromosome transmission fidelity protein 1